MQQGKQVSFTAVSANVSLVAFIDTTIIAVVSTVGLIIITYMVLCVVYGFDN